MILSRKASLQGLICGATGAVLVSVMTVAAGPRKPGGAQNQTAAKPTAAPAREPEHEEQGDGERIFQRLRWFYRQRQFPLGYIPPGVRLRAQALRRQMQREEAAERSLAGPPGFSGPSPVWTAIGPRPINSASYGAVAGRVSALAVDPTDSSVVYLGAAQGGIWKTTDGGNNWSPLTDAEPSLAIGAVAIDPNNHDIIYAGTGEENFSGDSYYGDGILKSTNAGVSWASLVGPFGPAASNQTFIGGLTVQPGNGSVLLAGINSFNFNASGVYRSADGGASWTQVISNNNQPGTAVLFDPTNGNIAYAALKGVGVFRSTDGGQTWAQSTGSGANLFPTQAARIALAIAPSSPATLYAAVANVNSPSGGDLLGIWKTTDSGADWVKLTNAPDFCSNFDQCWYDLTITVDPANASVVYAGGEEFTDIYQTLDGGASWTLVQDANGVQLHPDSHALAFSADGSVLYFGNDGGVWSTPVPAAPAASFLPTWSNLNSTLEITQFYPNLGLHPTSAILFGGNQDNGMPGYSGSLAWTETGFCGDGSSAAIDFANPNNVYINCNGINIGKSTSGGSQFSFKRAQSGINASDRSAFIPPLIMDPANSSILYFGTFLLYQTKDGANTWTAISPDLTKGPGFFGNISAIAPALSNDNVVYVGTHDGDVQATANALAGAGAKWTNVSTGLPGASVTSVAADPHNAALVYAAVSGFSSGHVFKSANSGTNWSDISANLPNVPVNAIVVDPDAANTLYIGTDVGVFMTANGGATWSTLQNGLPNAAVLALNLQESNRLLFAGTHGRGVWELSLNGPTHFSVAAPATASAGVPFSATVTALDANNKTVAGYTGTIHFTLANADAGAALPADYTFVAADAGAHTFSNGFTLVRQGSQNIIATDTVKTGLTGMSAAIAVGPGPTTHFMVSAPAAATAGASFNITVTALDQFNNLASAYSGTVSFTSSDPSATLPAPSTLTGGTGTFSVTLKTAGSKSVTATDNANSSITGSASVTVAPAAAAKFAVAVPTTGTVNTAFNVQVTALDAFGNTATAYGGSVQLTAGAGSTAAATFPPASTLTNGVGNFPVTPTTTGTLTVVATDTMNSSITGASPSMQIVTDAFLHPGAPRTLRLFRNPVPMIVATFTDDDPNETGLDFTANINWGDGSASAGTIVRIGGVPNLFEVLGNHAYARKGRFKVMVTVKDSGGSVANMTATASFFPRNYSF